MNIRVELPQHLRTLAKVDGEVLIDGGDAPTIASVLDALEQRYPVLRGPIRHHVTLERRPFVRFFACGEDLSHQAQDTPLPEAVVNGSQALMIVGAMAGG